MPKSWQIHDSKIWKNLVQFQLLGFEKQQGSPVEQLIETRACTQNDVSSSVTRLSTIVEIYHYSWPDLHQIFYKAICNLRFRAVGHALKKFKHVSSTAQNMYLLFLSKSSCYCFCQTDPQYGNDYVKVNVKNEFQCLFVNVRETLFFYMLFCISDILSRSHLTEEFPHFSTKISRKFSTIIEILFWSHQSQVGLAHCLVVNSQ